MDSNTSVPVFAENQGPEPVFPTAEPKPTVQNSDEQIKTTASLAALATQRNTQTEEPFSSMVPRFSDMISNGDEELLRRQVSMDAQKKQLETLQAQQSALVKNPAAVALPPFKDHLKELLARESDAAAASPDPHALEWHGMAQLQESGAQDPTQAEILQKQHKEGYLDYVLENAYKAARMNAEVDRLQKEVEQQGLPGKILDWLSFPLQNYYTIAKAIPGAKSWLPGAVLSEQVQRLWTLPREQFDDELPKVTENIRRNSGLFAENKAVQLSALEALRSGSPVDQMMANGWAAMDIATLPGAGKVLRIGKSAAGIMLGVSNRAAAINSTALDLIKATRDVPKNAGGVGAINTSIDTVKNIIPGVLKTSSLMDSGVGVAGSVADKIVNTFQAIKEAGETLDLRTSRMSPQQMQAAVARTEKELADRFKNDNIVDIHDVPRGPSTTVGYKEVEPEGLNPHEAEAYHQSRMDELDSFYEKLYNYKPDPDAKITPAMAKEADQKLADIHDANLNAEYRYLDLKRTSGYKEMVDRAATPEDVQAARQSAASDVEEANRYEYGASQAQRPAITPGSIFEHGQDKATGVRTVAVHLGDTQGYSGYANLERAIQGVKDRGWKPEDVQIVKAQDQFFIKVTQDVSETGIMTPEIRATELPVNGKIAEFLKNANAMMHEYFVGPLIKQTHVKAGLNSRVVQPLVKVLTAPSSKGRKAIKAVIDLGQHEENPNSYNGRGKWYKLSEFGSNFERVAGRPPTEKEIMSYYAYKELNDVDFDIRNTNTWIEKARRGIQSISVENKATGFKVDRTNGRLVARPDFSERIYDAETHQWGKADELQDKFASGNYHVIELENMHKTEGGDPMKYVLSHKASTTVGPLDRLQMQYVEGGHRFYENKIFVKQAVIGNFSTEAGGGKYMLNPLTHSNHRTFTAAREWASKLEGARLAYLDQQKLAGEQSMTQAARDAAFDASPFKTFEKFEALEKAGQVRANTPFEAVYDRGSLSQELENFSGSKWADPGMPSYEQELISRGRMYYSPKGEHLRDEADMLAPTIDPFKSMARAMGNAIQTAAFSDMNTKVVEEWARMADPYIDYANLGANRSPQNIFNHGQLRANMSGTPEGLAVRRGLEQMRNIHKRLLNYKSPDDTVREFATRRFANWLENKGAAGDWLAGKVYSWQDASPIAALRGAVFDATIAFFSPVRLLLHSQIALAAATIHPLYGAKAGLMAPWVKLLSENRSESLLDHVAGWGKAVHGFENIDFKNMIKSFYRSGWGDVSGDAAMNDTYPILQKAQGIRQAGRVFYNMADIYNRSVAWQVAWKLAKDEAPELATDSEEFLNKVHVKTDDLSGNMTSASRAGWQTGFLSTTTQFMTYQARMLERMLPAAFGGNARLNAVQRTRLLGGQLLMYGAAGAPGLTALASYAGQQYQDATGQPLDDDTWRGISKGLFDSMLHGISGGELDTDWAGRAGMGTWGQFLEDMSNGRLESVLQFAGGPSVEVAGNVSNTILGLARYFKAQQIDELTSDDFQLAASDLMKNVATLNTAQKVYWMNKNGYLKDAKTGQPLIPTSTLDEWAVALGIPLRAEHYQYELIQDRQAREDFITAMANRATLITREAVDAQQRGDTVAQEHLNRVAAGWLQGFRGDPLLQDAIVKRSNEELKKSGFKFDDLVRQHETETGQKPLGENH